MKKLLKNYKPVLSWYILTEVLQGSTWSTTKLKSWFNITSFLQLNSLTSPEVTESNGSVILICTLSLRFSSFFSPADACAHVHECSSPNNIRIYGLKNYNYTFIFISATWVWFLKASILSNLNFPRLLVELYAKYSTLTNYLLKLRYFITILKFK